MAELERATSEIFSTGSEKVTEICLGNTRVKVKTDATPARLKQTRDLVEAKFAEFESTLEHGISPEQLSVLVAFNIAEDLLRERERLKYIRRQLLESSERLINRVESQLSQKKSG